MLLLLLACLAHRPEAPVPSSPAAEPRAAEAADEDAAVRADGARGVRDPALAALLAEHWAWRMRTAPIWASRLGHPAGDAEIGLAGLEGAAEERRAARAFLDRAAALPAPAAPEDALTLRLFADAQAQALALGVCRLEEWEIGPRRNAVVDWGSLQEEHPFAHPGGEDSYAARLRLIPAAVDAEIAALRRGLEGGRVANAESLRRVVEVADAQLALPDAQWSLYRAGRDAEIAALRAAFTRYRDFVRDRLLPAGREGAQAGLGGLPDGAACYAALVRRYTTLDTTPAALHALGLAELQAIHAEMAAVGRRALGTDALPEIARRLREDPALRFSRRADVEAKAAEALARAEAATPRAFGRLPQARCVVAPIPDVEAPYTTIAYYRQPGAERVGTYFVNSWAPETRPTFDAEALAFHESVPGHHLQIALSQELPEQPAFRRHLETTAFVEGWALYSERLADELGLYSGDLDRLGMLSFDAWRASRLVVDTGLHAMGWTRAQAVEFMLAHTLLAPNNIDNEVDRYLAWPGQALAYKTGQVELRALRAETEARLGPAFDLRAFHDLLLGAGALPLPELRARVEASWPRG